MVLLHAFGPVDSNESPNKPTIDGPFEGKVGNEVRYKFYSNDPDNNPVGFLLTGTMVSRSRLLIFIKDM